MGVKNGAQFPRDAGALGCSARPSLCIAAVPSGPASALLGGRSSAQLLKGAVAPLRARFPRAWPPPHPAHPPPPRPAPPRRGLEVVQQAGARGAAAVPRGRLPDPDHQARRRTPRLSSVGAAWLTVGSAAAARAAARPWPSGAALEPGTGGSAPLVRSSGLVPEARRALGTQPAQRPAPPRCAAVLSSPVPTT